MTVSIHPSVRPSVHPSVRPSVRPSGQYCVGPRPASMGTVCPKTLHPSSQRLNQSHVLPLLTTVRKRKLKWYGPVTRSDGLTKMILLGTIEGKRRRGRQKKKKWTDIIEEWTGKSFAKTQALAHNRQDWSKLVRKSSLRRPHDFFTEFREQASKESCLVSLVHVSFTESGTEQGVEVDERVCLFHCLTSS